jgi:CRP-like cAMP-binding protein
VVPSPLLRKLSRFTRLSADDQALLTRVTSERVRRFAAREDIVREGDKPDNIGLFQSGWGCRHKTLEDGRRQIVSLFLPGDICDLNVFVLGQMDHSISSITPVSLAEISRGGFEEVMLASPRVTQALWWDLLVASSIQREWTVNLGQRGAFERMAHLLCEVFIRLDVAGLVEGDHCEFPLTQTDLGEATGLSTVHVNRTLQELRAAELIVLNNKVLQVPDLDALKAAALFDVGYLHLGGDGRHLNAND